MTKRVLYDPETGEEFSAHAGDYWFLEPNKILKNDNGINLWLIVDGETRKKTVRKKDLIDEIYESQAKQTSLLNKRKSVGKGKTFSLTDSSGATYIVDSKGRITQAYEYHRRGASSFSGQWLFNGVADRWQRKVADWQTVLKNPSDYYGLYILDLDYGTYRRWSTKLKSLYERRP